MLFNQTRITSQSRRILICSSFLIFLRNFSFLKFSTILQFSIYLIRRQKRRMSTMSTATPKQAQTTANAHLNVLREKQANLFPSTQTHSKTPNAQIVKVVGRQPVKQTPQSEKSKDAENLTQSAKTRSLLSRLKGSSSLSLSF